ncbi:hypothetical protein [Chitinilyticum aquatile]|uniref:hypothetical protein n=1 Tax=Chitinilyticum aquatile TaxID=362520 RepID=UPI000404D987|nr:hypothetical protein [Chitinilyticum aquatile]
MSNKPNFVFSSGDADAIPAETDRRFAVAKPGNLREAMPETTAFIDSLRAVFGADLINRQIKGGMNGQPTFYARENGIEVGTPVVQGGRLAR